MSNYLEFIMKKNVKLLKNLDRLERQIKYSEKIEKHFLKQIGGNPEDEKLSKEQEKRTKEFEEESMMFSLRSAGIDKKTFDKNKITEEQLIKLREVQKKEESRTRKQRLDTVTENREKRNKELDVIRKKKELERQQAKEQQRKQKISELGEENTIINSLNNYLIEKESKLFLVKDLLSFDKSILGKYFILININNLDEPYLKESYEDLIEKNYKKIDVELDEEKLKLAQERLIRLNEDDIKIKYDILDYEVTLDLSIFENIKQNFENLKVKIEDLQSKETETRRNLLSLNETLKEI